MFNASIIWLGFGQMEWKGKYVAQGSGDFEGMKIFQSVTGSTVSGEVWLVISLTLKEVFLICPARKCSFSTAGYLKTLPCLASNFT